MAEVVDEVEIEMGGNSKKNRVFVANISDECIIGLDTMRMFKMILGVGKGMVGVNGKVLPGCFKYVGGAEEPLYPVETVRRVELEPSSVTTISKKNRVFVANIPDECIIGLDTMRMFKMILDVGKGMVGVNGKVLPGCFKYVGGAEVPLYPVETVRRVELEPSSVTKIPDTVKGGGGVYVILKNIQIKI